MSSKYYDSWYMVVPVLTDQQELLYINSEQAEDVVWKTWLDGSMRERERERERGGESREICAVSVTWW